MNKLVTLVVILTLVTLFGLNFLSNKRITPQSSSLSNNQPVATTEDLVTPTTDIKASFAIFTNGTFRIFTASMYHNLSEDAYIESSNPNTVHVKKTGLTWNDFFSTLPFKLTSKCLTTGTKETFCTGNGGSLKFYINGEQNNNALGMEINEDDKLLVTFGNESFEEVRKQIDLIP